MINPLLQYPHSTSCREFGNSCWVSYGLLTWKNWLWYVSVHGWKCMLKSRVWAIRSVVFFSHAVTLTRGLFLHMFSWAQLTLASSTSVISFLEMCPIPAKRWKHGRVVTSYLKLKAQRLYIELSKKCGFQCGFSEPHDLLHCEIVIGKRHSWFLHRLTFLPSLRLFNCGIGNTFLVLES